MLMVTTRRNSLSLEPVAQLVAEDAPASAWIVVASHANKRPAAQQTQLGLHLIFPLVSRTLPTSPQPQSCQEAGAARIYDQEHTGPASW